MARTKTTDRFIQVGRGVQGPFTHGAARVADWLRACGFDAWVVYSGKHNEAGEPLFFVWSCSLN